MANNCKYYKEKQQVSYDFGVTWLDTGDYRKGSLIEYQSSDCPVAFDGKWLATYSGGTTSSAECDSTSAITQNEVTKTDLVEVLIGDCVTTIGEYAFRYSTSLTSIDIPNSVTSIGYAAFSYCSSLSSVTIGSGVISIGDGAFEDCTSLTSCTIGSGVTSIGNQAFWGCSSLTSIDIPDSVTSIGNYAFIYCSGLTSCTIGSGVTSIGTSTFNSCTSLTSIDIPNSVTSIGTLAFSNCTSLTSITCNATTPPALGNNVFYKTNDCPIYVPCQSVDAYKSASGWSNYASRIQGIPPCGEPQYRTISGTPYCTGVDKYQDVYDQVSYDSGSTWQTTATTSVLIEAQSTDCGYVPPTPTFDGKWLATYPSGTSSAECDASSAITKYEIDASNIIAIEIGSCVTTISASTFRYCSGLTSCTIGSCVTSIGATAFEYCSGLTRIDIPSGVTSIGNNAFKYCRSLTSITIPNSVTNIGYQVFMFCRSLTSVIIPNSITSIEQQTFEYCSGLTSVTIGSSVTSIGELAFSGCTNLGSITCNATTPPTLGSRVFDYTNDCPIYVPAESVSAYQSAWSTYASRIQAIP